MSRPANRRFFASRLQAQLLESEILPTLFSRKSSADDIRAWVMDCGSGEAAYSLAILLGEANIPARLPLHVLATDTDPHVVARARHGRFPTAIESDLTPERLGRWFFGAEDMYHVTAALRSLCTFSVHRFTHDVPFSHLDLVDCGRLLSHLGPAMQDMAAPLLHFALRPGGWLIAADDSCLSRHPTLFSRVSDGEGVHVRLDGGRRFFPGFPLSDRPGATAQSSLTGATPEPRGSEPVHQLETALRSTRDELRSTFEQLRASNRRLQFSNEEYQSLNEELTATSEELRSSKAELQSMNRELATVNGELVHRIKDLRQANSDISNFLSATGVCTLFLDKQLCIVRFTPSISAIFHVVQSDVGRPITDIACRLAYFSLPEDAAQVVATLVPMEREVRDPATGSRHLVRIVPYRSPDDFIVGTVVTFVDISALTRAEEALRESDERFHAMASCIPAALFTADAQMAWTYVNPRFREFTGIQASGALGSGWRAAVHPDDLAELDQALEAAQRSGAMLEREFRMRNQASGYRWYFLRATAAPAGGGGWTGSLLDINDRHLAEARQRKLFIELQHRVKSILGTVRSVAGHARDQSADLDEFFAHFDGRLDALARTQASLARNGDACVDLEELIAEEILSQATGCEDQITLSGPAVCIDERSSQAIGLAIHELATNAIKFGSLAKSSGTVAVCWRLDDSQSTRRLLLEWTERIVPILDPNPKRIGFGREYLERRLAAETGGTTKLSFQPGGIRFALDLPLPTPQPPEEQP